LSQKHKFLIVKLGALGDIFFALPSVQYIQKSLPNSQVDWLIDENLKPVLELAPGLGQVFEVQSSQLYKGSFIARLKTLWNLRKILPGSYSAIFLMHRSLAYSIFLLGKGPVFALARAPHPLPHFSTNLNRLWNSLSFPPLQIHESLQIQKLIEFGLKSLEAPTGFSWLPVETVGAADSPIGLHLGGGQNAGNNFQLKQWPHWEKFILLLLESTCPPVVLFGSAADQKEAEKIFQQIPDSLKPKVRNLVGVLNLPELSHEIRKCQFFIGTDSGPLHIADYLGVPALGLYGPTSPKSWGLLRPGSQAISKNFSCQPCYKDDGEFPPCSFSQRCMQELTPEAVLRRLPSTFEKSAVR
jgi:ADP-heptose:LPS heptosyltransferase